MALINCPECAKKISDKVKACPHCGYPFEEEDRRTSSHSSIVHSAAVICPRCGADLEVDADAEKCFCMYCGSEIMIEKEEDFAANLQASSEKYYEAALEALSANNTTEALLNLEKVLKINPDHYKAIMVKGVCIALNTELKLLKADSIISYFELSKAKFMQKKPGEKEIAGMELLHVQNLLFTCKTIFDDAQETYINDGKRKILAEYDCYWLGMDANTELAMYAIDRFKNRDMVLNNDIYAVFTEMCDLTMKMCYEGYQKRWSYDRGVLIMRERDRLEERYDRTERIKKNAREMRNMQKKVDEANERKKYWQEHPEEYEKHQQKRQALLDARAEQNRIIQENRNKRFGGGAKARKAAEEEIDRINYKLDNM